MLSGAKLPIACAFHALSIRSPCSSQASPPVAAPTMSRRPSPSRSAYSRLKPAARAP